jgi:hypothetical protein
MTTPVDTFTLNVPTIEQNEAVAAALERCPPTMAHIPPRRNSWRRLAG